MQPVNIEFTFLKAFCLENILNHPGKKHIMVKSIYQDKMTDQEHEDTVRRLVHCLALTK